MGFLIFLLLPLSGIRMLYYKDHNEQRKQSLNRQLLINMGIFLFPVIYATVFAQGSSADRSTALWLYLPILPGCTIWQIILISRKIKYSKEKAE